MGCSPWDRKESDMTERLHFHVLEKEMAAHSSVLAWRIPGMEESGGLPSVGSQSRTRLQRQQQQCLPHCRALQVAPSDQSSHSVVSNSGTPCTAARQASLSVMSSQSLLKLMAIQSVMPSNHLILCRPLLLSPSIPPSIRVFSDESALRIRWPKYWSFSVSISPSNE